MAAATLARMLLSVVSSLFWAGILSRRIMLMLQVMLHILMMHTLMLHC